MSTIAHRKLWVACVAAAASAGAQSQAVELDASLNESVQVISKKGALFSVELETTIYKPEGDGPFPIAIVNHGKSPGDTRFQGRYRPAQAARYFLQRGYAVVVPMRQGFSKSTGNYIGGGCNMESNGRVQAEDVKAVLDHLSTQPWADKNRIVVVGQSHGGWTTLAFGPLNYPGVKGLVNFAGGLRQETCPQWKDTMASAAASYARETKVPSIWFYGDNDSFFDPDTWRTMLDKYKAAGGNVEMVAFGKFGSDSHALFGSRAGNAIWQPEMTKFLASVGMPSQVQANYMKFGASTAMAPPPATQFAALDDETKVPYLRDSGRTGYKTYLTKGTPRAFAVAPSGSWGWAEGGDDPLKRALDLCNRAGKGECKLYSVDDYIVWNPQ